MLFYSSDKLFATSVSFFQGVVFAKIPAETFPKVSMQYKISAVPTFLFFLLNKQVDRLDGANAAKLTQMVKNNVT